jgi:hypothetical protein
MAEDERQKASEMARELGRLGASKGGKARAEKLTQEERSEIARQAVEARWAKIRAKATNSAEVLRATHGSPKNPLRIGDIEIPCYVLEDGSRVITHRGLQRSLAMPVKGGATETANFIAQFERKGVDCKDLTARLSKPREFLPPVGGRTAFGYNASVLADMCDVILAARAAGLLTPRQQTLAEHCEILVRAFARTGIDALIDEATGYQDVRPRDDLHRILELYIAKELLPWSKRFPDEFYQQLFRLKSWEYPPRSSKRPKLIGKLTEQLVYKRLPPGVLEELRQKNPVTYKGGSRKARHHQLLSEEIGNPHLEKQVLAVTTILRISRDWHEFVELFERSDPNAPHQGRLQLTADDDE